MVLNAHAWLTPRIVLARRFWPASAMSAPPSPSPGRWFKTLRRYFWPHLFVFVGDLINFSSALYYWSRWTDVLEILSRCLGQMSREASTWKINNLDLIIADQMIFTPSPGARPKMITLFMTVTWLAGVDRIFISPVPMGLLLRCA